MLVDDKQAREKMARSHSRECTLYVEPDKGKNCDCGYADQMIIESLSAQVAVSEAKLSGLTAVIESCYEECKKALGRDIECPAYIPDAIREIAAQVAELHKQSETLVYQADAWCEVWELIVFLRPETAFVIGKSGLQSVKEAITAMKTRADAAEAQVAELKKDAERMEEYERKWKEMWDGPAKESGNDPS